MDLLTLKVHAGESWPPDGHLYSVLRNGERVWTVFPLIHHSDLQTVEDRLDLQRSSVDVAHHPYYRRHEQWSVTWLDRRVQPDWRERRVTHFYATQERALKAAFRWVERFEATRRLTGKVVAVSDWNRWKIPSSGDEF